jgi:phage/plasmid primase-like uncharacterized protein
MTDQEAREFLERLAVPNRTQPPPCPLCGGQHQLELRCAELASRLTSALVAQPS